MKGHKGLHHRKSGGAIKVYGNPHVIEEAEHGEGSTRKRGGKVKRARGGKIPGLMTGGAVRTRLDRVPGRKRGGAVGADKSPLSTAHKGHANEGEGSSSPTDTYGGLKDD